jgi:Ca-activated chloride channel family protein
MIFMVRSRLFATIALCVTPLVLISQDPAPVTVRITSPLGRTGGSGSVRIVAQVRTAVERPFPTVRFLVDGKVIKIDDDGPPYAADWLDDDLLLRREIVVEAKDAAGYTASDSVTLRPIEVADTAQVTSVLVDVTVYSKNGRLLNGLNLDDFLLRENGTPQTVEIASLEKVPATFALLVDSSQSMAPRVDFVRLAAQRLLPYLRPLDRIIVAPFSVGLGPITGPTADGKTIFEAISAIKPSGGTAILDALTEMAERLKGVEGRRAIILVTDGFDENSKRSFDTAIKAAQDAQTTVYVVGVGGVFGISLEGQTLLRRLATETGGKAFFPWRESEIGQAYDFLVTDAQNRYLLFYTPSDQAQDGTWRAIEVATKTDDVVIQARKGYFASKPPPVQPEIEFTLTDAEQRYIDVTADDLVVLEDGVEQKIGSFREAVSSVSIVLALDASGSMRRAAAEATDAARGFVTALREKDSLSVLLFADEATFAHDFSTNREPSLKAIGQYAASGGTALYDALVLSLARLKKVDGRRVVVVVTDGRDENNPGTGPGSTHGFDEVVRQIKESGATVFGVGLGANVDRKTLEEAAKLSGGQAYFPSDVATLATEYERIVLNLRRRFVLSYESTNSKRDGTWRKVEIRTRSSNLLVSSAGGYFAPAK